MITKYYAIKSDIVLTQQNKKFVKRNLCKTVNTCSKLVCPYAKHDICAGKFGGVKNLSNIQLIDKMKTCLYENIGK